jgi:hypothetical protein
MFQRGNSVIWTLSADRLQDVLFLFSQSKLAYFQRRSWNKNRESGCVFATLHTLLIACTAAEFISEN